MPIINIQTVQAGLVGVLPSLAYIDTSDPLATVLTTGYLNHEVQNGAQFSIPCIAAVSTKETPTSASRIGWFAISHSGANWSLVSASSPAAGVVTLPTVNGNVAIFTDTIGTLADGAVALADLMTNALANGHIFVGSAGGVATDVAMSGDATIANTGALTIAANAITTAKILNANVTLAKLAAGITPSHIIKFAGQPTTAGGAAAEAITVTGALATDLAFVQMVDNGTNNVTIVSAVMTSNTLTVTFSGDPGADAVINYQIIRAAA